MYNFHAFKNELFYLSDVANEVVLWIQQSNITVNDILFLLCETQDLKICPLLKKPLIVQTDYRRYIYIDNECLTRKLPHSINSRDAWLAVALSIINKLFKKDLLSISNV